ncbi:hypothetical protein ABIE26_001899 [Pedobacter africanus]|uniref:Uncharacterized protein n=1 Tax=Pedobacter africanus TaxID=151894 RepID=A0ACC6KR31_9SPHI|nr:hypothetical protein [Pedobacter africanus]MDR6781613.1 hypothetical protein [Pedobacter africanus]
MEPLLISYVITEFFAEVSVTDQLRVTDIRQEQAILSFFAEANDNLNLININYLNKL